MIKKVLLATINSSHPQRGMSHAFGSLFEASEFDYLELHRRGLSNREITDLLVAAAVQVRPDWLWLQLQDTGVIQAEGLREIRRRVPDCVMSHWMGDCRAEVSPYLASVCQSTDLTYIAAWGQRALFQAAGAPEVHYLPIGLDWHEDVLGERPVPSIGRVPEVLMCGNDYGDAFPGGKTRRECLRALIAADIDAGVVGNGWPSDIPAVGSCHVKEQVHVWRRAKVAVGVSNFNDIPLYYSDRQLISMVSGTPLVCYQIPGLEREFTDGEHCLFFRTPVELVSKVQRLLADEDLRLRVGAAGSAVVLRDHTWFSRVMQVLPDVERVRARLTAGRSRT